jgi:hypothetical protein
MDIFVTTIDGQIIHKIHVNSFIENNIYNACENYCKLNSNCYININKNNNMINIVNSKLIITANSDDEINISDDEINTHKCICINNNLCGETCNNISRVSEYFSEDSEDSS